MGLASITGNMMGLLQIRNEGMDERRKRRRRSNVLEADEDNIRGMVHRGPLRLAEFCAGRFEIKQRFFAVDCFNGATRPESRTKQSESSQQGRKEDNSLVVSRC